MSLLKATVRYHNQALTLRNKTKTSCMYTYKYCFLLWWAFPVFVKHLHDSDPLVVMLILDYCSVHFKSDLKELKSEKIPTVRFWFSLVKQRSGNLMEFSFPYYLKREDKNSACESLNTAMHCNMLINWIHSSVTASH